MIVIMRFCRCFNRICVCVFVICHFCSCSAIVDKIKDIVKWQQERRAVINDRKYKDSIAIADENRALFNIEWGISHDDFLQEIKLLKSQYLHKDEIGYRLAGIPIDSVIKGLISERYGLFQITLSSKKYKGTPLGDFRIYPQEVESIYSQLKQFMCRKYGFYSKSESTSNDELTVWQVGNKTITLKTKEVVHRDSEPMMNLPYAPALYNNDFYKLVEVIIVNIDIEKKREMLKLEKLREMDRQKQSVIDKF